MKYVIFRYKSVYMPVIIPEHVSHSQVSVQDAQPVSAGFFRINNDIFNTITVYGQSDSLGLKPYKDDCDLIRGVLVNMGTSYFLTENYPPRL